MRIVSIGGVLLEESAAIALRMLVCAARADGVDLTLSRGFGPHTPYSEGRTIDFENVAPSLPWLRENSARFGWVQLGPAWTFQWRPRDKLKG